MALDDTARRHVPAPCRGLLGLEADRGFAAVELLDRVIAYGCFPENRNKEADSFLPNA